MFIVLEIPHIPLREAERALSYFQNQLCVNAHFIWKDGICVFFHEEEKIIKGPKLTDVISLQHFKNKMLKENNSGGFYENETNIYYSYTFKCNPLEIIKNIPWLKPIKIYEDTCCRPVRRILLATVFEEDNMEDYCGVKPEFKNFSWNTLKSYYENKNTLLTYEDKMEHLQVPYKISEDILHNTTKPALVFIPLQEKYRTIPEMLMVFILEKEQQVISVYENEVLKGFNFVLDHAITYKEGVFDVAINSRLEDLRISYERDKKVVIFREDTTINEFTSFGLNLAKEMHLLSNTLNEKKLIFLLNNHKNDFNTTIVEEYPPLLGVISYYVYKAYKNYDKEIHDAFLSYRKCIINDYGLILYLTDNLYFLQQVSYENHLATATKDPFATKTIVDDIIKTLWAANLNLPKMHVNLLELFHKRIAIFFSDNEGGKYLNYKNIPLSEISNLLNFLITHITTLKNLVTRITYFIKTNKGHENYQTSLPEKHMDVFLLKEMKKVENILNTINIQENPEYVRGFETFLCNINKVFYLS